MGHVVVSASCSEPCAELCERLKCMPEDLAKKGLAVWSPIFGGMYILTEQATWILNRLMKK